MADSPHPETIVQPGTSSPGTSSKDRWKRIDDRLEQSHQFFAALQSTSPIGLGDIHMPARRDQSCKSQGDGRTDSLAVDRVVWLEAEVTALQGEVNAREEDISSVMQDFACKTRFWQRKFEEVALEQHALQKRELESTNSIEQMTEKLRRHEAQRVDQSSALEQHEAHSSRAIQSMQEHVGSKDDELRRLRAELNTQQDDVAAVRATLKAKEEEQLTQQAEWEIQSQIHRSEFQQHRVHTVQQLHDVATKTTELDTSIVAQQAELRQCQSSLTQKTVEHDAVKASLAEREQQLQCAETNREAANKGYAAALAHKQQVCWVASM
jgi:chromosome segregation ATPase